MMLVHGYSRLPVIEGDEVVGMLDERQVLNAIGGGQGALDLPISLRMMAGPPVVEGAVSGTAVWNLLVKGDGLVMVRDAGEWKGILTASDLLSALTMPASPEFAI
ncbi:MAG: CBS domain-containing protein [Spirochaetes bacterium]|nr:CBS domain-containing protein [Spirochaetota bacterium]